MLFARRAAAQLELSLLSARRSRGALFGQRRAPARDPAAPAAGRPRPVTTPPRRGGTQPPVGAARAGAAPGRGRPDRRRVGARPQQPPRGDGRQPVAGPRSLSDVGAGPGDDVVAPLREDLDGMELAIDRAVDLTRGLLQFARREDGTEQVADVGQAIEARHRAGRAVPRLGGAVGGRPRRRAPGHRRRSGRPRAGPRQPRRSTRRTRSTDRHGPDRGVRRRSRPVARRSPVGGASRGRRRGTVRPDRRRRRRASGWTPRPRPAPSNRCSRRRATPAGAGSAWRRSWPSPTPSTGGSGSTRRRGRGPASGSSCRSSRRHPEVGSVDEPSGARVAAGRPERTDASDHRRDAAGRRPPGPRRRVRRGGACRRSTASRRTC